MSRPTRPPASSSTSAFSLNRSVELHTPKRLALVNPSVLESFSIVLMEAWLEGTPAIVASGSEVMREHCEESGGGFVFDSYETYRDAVNQLLDEPEIGRRLGQAGRNYVRGEYSWPAVRRRLQTTIEKIAA